jgi:hypothetical protein
MEKRFVNAPNEFICAGNPVILFVVDSAKECEYSWIVLFIRKRRGGASESISKGMCPFTRYES